MAGLLVEKTIGGEDLVFDFVIGEKEASLGRIVAISRNDVECGLLVILGSAFLFFNHWIIGIFRWLMWKNFQRQWILKQFLGYN